jgi:transcriptional regulator with XRE-family HTH domain
MKKRDLLLCSKTQQEIADELGVSQPMVSKWFSGSVIPRIATIYKICEVIEVEYSELVDYIYARNKKLVELSKKQKR